MIKVLFFCYFLTDMQEHFYHEFKAKYLVTTPDGAYNTDAVGKLLVYLGVSENDILSKFSLSETKKAIQASKRWRTLFILNDPTLVTFPNKLGDPQLAEDLKWQILHRLDDHVRAAVRNRIPESNDMNSPPEPISPEPLPAFEVSHFDEPRGQSLRKKCGTNMRLRELLIHSVKNLQRTLPN